MKNIFNNIWWTLLGIFMIILAILIAFVWFSTIFALITDAYERNPNLLFIIIPVFIVLHIWMYFLIKYTKF